jgi:hypothetical protein
MLAKCAVWLRSLKRPLRKVSATDAIECCKSCMCVLPNEIIESNEYKMLLIIIFIENALTY